MRKYTQQITTAEWTPYGNEVLRKTGPESVTVLTVGEHETFTGDYQDAEKIAEYVAGLHNKQLRMIRAAFRKDKHAEEKKEAYTRGYRHGVQYANEHGTDSKGGK